LQMSFKDNSFKKQRQQDSSPESHWAQTNYPQKNGSNVLSD